MTNPTHLLVLTALLLSSLSLAPSSARAEDTLWNLTFKDLKPGQALAEVPYAAPCSGPQKVTTDPQNTLAGGSAMDTLTNPLVFDKESGTHYAPALTLKATSPFTKGIITVNLDVIFDKITPSAANPVETLVAMPFINGDGGSTYILVIACSGPNELTFGGAGLKKGATPSTFPAGKVAHVKAVLDLNAHTFQAFLNDAPMADAEHDDAKFSSFLGFTIRDGTALGGNKGATFTAGIGNLVITHS
jgi:hypothetical protein